MPGDPELSGHHDGGGTPPVVQLAPPVSEVAWSPDFMAQDLEILMVLKRADGVRWLKPQHADSLRVGWPVGENPGAIVVNALRRYGLTPLVAHSTSWRHEDKRVVLTYLGVVEATAPTGGGPLVELPVGHAELARGDSLGPPESIAVAQVLEHALRHLAWLVKDDEAIARALPDWRSELAGYQPEPFQSF